jgi:hypothetical protein
MKYWDFVEFEFSLTYNVKKNAPRLTGQHGEENPIQNLKTFL